MSRRYAPPDRVEEAGRAAVRGDRPEVSKEEGALARGAALLAPIRVDADDERKAALTVTCFWAGSRLARAAQVAEARRLLDILGLLPPPPPAPEPEAAPDAEAPDTGQELTSAERQRLAKAERVAQFGRLVREEGLGPEDAARAMGLRASTGVEYARILRSQEQREQYFEARGIGFTTAEAAEYAGIRASQRKSVERDWRDQQRAARGGGGS